jgi:hypothetical protein
VAIAKIDRLARPRLAALQTTGVVVGGLAGWVEVGLAGGGWE